MANFPNRCQHIKVNGTQCGCPALRHNKLCYFHKRNHEERVELNLDRLKNARARRRKVVMELPVLEDANSIQVSLMQIMRLIIGGEIDGKTAGLLLYALQTASSNLPRVRFDPFMHDVILDPKTVNETPLDAHVWEDSDFSGDEDDATMRVEALEEARLRATKKAELDRWAEGEANRLIAEGNRQREATRKAEAQDDVADSPEVTKSPAMTPTRKRPSAMSAWMKSENRSAPRSEKHSPTSPQRNQPEKMAAAADEDKGSGLLLLFAGLQGLPVFVGQSAA